MPHLTAPPVLLTSHQVAAALGVPYSTLLKWQTTDGLLRPILGPGGRRGGDRWPRTEVELACAVARLRTAGMPVRFIKTVVEAIRFHDSAKKVAVYAVIHVRGRADCLERRIPLVEIEPSGLLDEPSRLT